MSIVRGLIPGEWVYSANDHHLRELEGGSRGMCGKWEVEVVYEELCNGNDQVLGY